MRILAVDDDPIILEIISHVILGHTSHTITTVESGQKAIELIAEKSVAAFDCFILDIQMPGMDGVELTRRIRAFTAYRLSPILMITAMNDKKHIDSAFEAGANDYVTKPFDLQDVLARVALAERRVTEFAAATAASATASKPANQGRRNIMSGHMGVGLNSEIAIFDVPGLIESSALRNYLTSLSQNNLFGSGVFSFSIRGVQPLFDSTSPYEFNGLIADVAEAISDTLDGYQFLFCYTGNGTFDCVIEGGHQPALQRLVDEVNMAIHRLDICLLNGRRPQIRVCSGLFLRLVWRSGSSVIEALARVHDSAEENAAQLESRLDDFWYMGKVIQ